MTIPDMKVIVYHIDLESEGRNSPCDSVTRKEFDELKGLVMSAKVQIEKFEADMKAHQDSKDKAIDALQTTVAGLTQDNATNVKAIKDLQNTPDAWTSDDQASLDRIQSREVASGDRLRAVADALNALDALTPPPVPTA